ncbi:hypothetical protein [Phreatobacter sp.]|uniref:hypothetical protein n=1 Tax=Phreatobacter sp. TaxID=1966341 RepID=UPI0025DF1D41|nr:hypothetical protein [Phreatobacter sp.]
MGFHRFDHARSGSLASGAPDNAFAVLDALASDATAATLAISQGDQMTVTAGGALKVEEAPHGWTVTPPPRRNLVVTLLRPGAAVDPDTGEAVDRIARKQLPMDAVLVIPRPLNAERLTVDTVDRRKLTLGWPNTSPLDKHDWGASR